MRHRKLSFLTVPLTATCVVVSIISVSVLASGQEKVLHRFKAGDDGANPIAALVADKAGNLYGTTLFGGTGPCQDVKGIVIGCGVVFKLSPPAKLGSRWNYRVLYSFHDGLTGNMGTGVSASALTLDQAGNLYGTTAFGGLGNKGTVFELTLPPQPDGEWTAIVLYKFLGGLDGANPSDWGGVVFDHAGNIFGTAFSGGKRDRGTVFELTPPKKQGSPWKETTIYRFKGVPHYRGDGDGESPLGVVLGEKGTLYGVTVSGGHCEPGGDCTGSAFKLKAPGQPGGAWTEEVIFRGNEPGTNVIRDKSGALYGSGSSSVYMLRLQGGAWTLTTLHSFERSPDGFYTYAQPTLDEVGNLYGTTFFGGAFGFGIVYQLSPPANENGPWTETILYDFAGGRDGESPFAALVFGKAGALYGTTIRGGLDCPYYYEETCGTIFKVIP